MNFETSLADLHTHSTYSDGAARPSEIVRRAVAIGLRLVAVTDHDRIDGALEAVDSSDPATCQVIVGEEVTTIEGHVLGLFLTHTVRPGRHVAETIADIHAQGGLAIPAHPFLQLGGARGTGAVGAGMAWDAIEVENGSPLSWMANRAAQRAKPAWARAETGGSDAHILIAVGCVVTSFPGRTASDLREAIKSGTTRAIRRDRSPVITVQTLGRSVRLRLAREIRHRLDRQRRT